MRDLVGNLMILCVKYIELNCEERLEENLGDIVLCVLEVISCTQLLSQLNEKMLAVYIIIPRGY